MEPLQQQADRHISSVHPLPLSTIEARARARNVMAADYTAFPMAISSINCEMDRLRSSYRSCRFQKPRSDNAEQE